MNRTISFVLVFVFLASAGCAYEQRIRSRRLARMNNAKESPVAAAAVQPDPVPVPQESAAKDCAIDFGRLYPLPAGTVLRFIETTCGYEIVTPPNEWPNYFVSFEKQNITAVEEGLKFILDGKGFEYELDREKKQIAIRHTKVPENNLPSPADLAEVLPTAEPAPAAPASPPLLAVNQPPPPPPTARLIQEKPATQVARPTPPRPVAQASRNAPDACEIRLSGKAGKPASAWLQIIESTCGFEVVYNDAADVPNQLIFLDGKSFDTVSEAVAANLQGLPYIFRENLSEKTITIKRDGVLGGPAAVRTQRAEVVEPPAPKVPAISRTIRNLEEAPPPPTGRESYQDYIARENARVIAQSNAYLAMNTGHSYDGGYYGNQYGRNQYGYGYGGYATKGCETGPSGSLKIKYLGEKKERQLWQVKINGVSYGSIDQADSLWNGVAMCAGTVQVTVRKLGWGPTGIAEHQDMYSIRPWELTEIPIGEFLFEMDSHSEPRRRVLTEQ